MMTVLLEYIDRSLKCLILLLTLNLQYPAMLVLWLMLLMTHYVQNYASIIGRSLNVIMS